MATNQYQMQQPKSYTSTNYTAQPTQPTTTPINNYTTQNQQTNNFSNNAPKNNTWDTSKFGFGTMEEAGGKKHAWTDLNQELQRTQDVIKNRYGAGMDLTNQLSHYRNLTGQEFDMNSLMGSNQQMENQPYMWNFSDTVNNFIQNSTGLARNVKRDFNDWDNLKSVYDQMEASALAISGLSYDESVRGEDVKELYDYYLSTAKRAEELGYMGILSPAYKIGDTNNESFLSSLDRGFAANEAVNDKWKSAKSFGTEEGARKSKYETAYKMLDQISRIQNEERYWGYTTPSDIDELFGTSVGNDYLKQFTNFLADEGVVDQDYDVNKQGAKALLDILSGMGFGGESTPVLPEVKPKDEPVAPTIDPEQIDLNQLNTLGVDQLLELLNGLNGSSVVNEPKSNAKNNNDYMNAMMNQLLAYGG